MPAIKEIRKIESNIKEVPKEKKVESIDDEFEEDDVEEVNFSFSSRRENRSSTLEATERKQDTFEDRQDRISKEDKQEINFRPSYAGGGDPYKSNSYTPLGSAESSNARDLGERGIGNERNLMDNRRGQNDDGNRERNYAGDKDQRDRKRNLM